MMLQFKKEYDILSIGKKYGKFNQKQFGKFGNILFPSGFCNFPDGFYLGLASFPLYGKKVSFFGVGRFLKTDELTDIKKRETWGQHRPPGKVTGYTGSKGQITASSKNEILRLVKANFLFLFNNKFLLSGSAGYPLSSYGVRGLFN